MDEAVAADARLPELADEPLSPEVPAESGVPGKVEAEYRRFWLLIGSGWLGTTLGYAIYDLPLKTLLKDSLGLNTVSAASFFFIGQCFNYVKPLAAIFTDAIPFFGTRRRNYLLSGLAACALMWLLLAVVPRRYDVLLATFTLMYVSVVLISTTLGGVMTEGGARFHASGRLSAQRLGIMKAVGIAGGLAGGWLAKQAFGLTCGLVAATHLLLIPLFWSQLREPKVARPDFRALDEVARQGRVLLRSRTLWAAAGLVILIVAAPGFAGNVLFYYQRDALHFDTRLIGIIQAVGAASSIPGAFLFGRLCRRFSLRPLLCVAILTHAGAALLYFGYRSAASALVITAVYEAAQTVALLPLYDLAIRATPKGSEALGYSVMMSVWNLTSALSDLVGSWLYTPHVFHLLGHVVRVHVAFQPLILVNAGTTALVLIAVPLLPRALTDRKDGEPVVSG